ncbi:MAG: aldehyde:ferredoxin oxidoreductase, partial [Gammaproteobacteria bacterium]
KNLKAVIATGRRKVEIMDDATFAKLQTSTNKYLRAHPMTGDVLPRLGTPALVNITAGRNILPVNNFQRGTDRRAVNISGEKLAAEEMEKRSGCINCPIVCGRSVKLKDKIVKGPEFETLGLMGSNLGNFDLKLVLELNQICDDMGMDSISTGGSIGFATELTEKGLLSSDLSFDQHDGICDLVRDIAHRRGLGDDLADGVKRMSEKFGGTEYAIHVKGLELPSYDPRGCYGQGLEYATTNRGGCHVQGSTMFFEATGPLNIDPLSVRAKPQLVVMQQNLVAAISSSVFCVFATYGVIPAFIYRLNPQGLVARVIAQAVLNSGPILSMALKMKAPFKILWFEKFLSYIFGRTVTLGDFIETGERVFNMERLYNVREGFSASDDTLPARLLNESTFKESERGVPLDEMLPKYYRLRGWDSGGIPTEKTLKRLQIRH